MNRNAVSGTLLLVLAGLGLLLASSGVASSAATQATQRHDAALVGLLARLKGPIAKYQPDATIKLVDTDGDDTLRAQYQTREFLVYDRAMTGAIGRDPHKELGPDFRGFLLNVSTGPAPFNEQWVPNQTLREPYWQTYLTAYEIRKPHECLLVSISYGARTDPKLIAAIKQTIADYASKR